MLRLSLFILFNALVLISSQPQTMKIGQVADVTWNNVGKYSEFTVTSTLVGSEGWVGIGFGKGMNFMNTIICKHTPSVKTVEHYYNEWFSSKPLSYPRVGLSNVSVSVENSTLTCRFNRENRNQAQNYYQISETGSSITNFVAAYGDVKANGDIIKHKQSAKSLSPARFSVDLINRPTIPMPSPSVPSWMTTRRQGKNNAPTTPVSELPAVPTIEAPTYPATEAPVYPAIEAPVYPTNETPVYPTVGLSAFSSLISIFSFLKPETLNSVIGMINPDTLNMIQSFLKPEIIGMFTSFLSNPSLVANLDKVNTKNGIPDINSIISPDILDKVKPFLTPSTVAMVQPYLTTQNIALLLNFLNKDNLGMFSNFSAKPENIANVKQGLGNLVYLVNRPNYVSYIQSFNSPQYYAMFQNFLTKPEYMNTFIWPMYNVNWMNVLSQWNKEFEMPQATEEQTKLRYYNELGYLQNYFTTTGTPYINTCMSLLGPSMFNQLYNSPGFIHFCNYCIRNAN